MAHGHDFAFRLVVLKTSEGYLTKTGFTHDITSPDILILNAGSLGGKWTPPKARIEGFKKYFNLDIHIDEKECEFYTFNSSDINRINPSKWSW